MGGVSFSPRCQTVLLPTAFVVLLPQQCPHVFPLCALLFAGCEPLSCSQASSTRTRMERPQLSTDFSKLFAL